MAAADRATLEGIVGPLGFFRAKTESLLKLSAALVERPRRPGAAPARRPGQAARRRSQDRQRRARQRLRHPGHHRRHPLRPADPPLRLDRGDRPGQGRARHRRALREARLDDAQPPPDLARPPGLPRAEARVRRLPGRALVPVVRRGPDRPARPRSWSGPRAAHEADAAVAVARSCGVGGAPHRLRPDAGARAPARRMSTSTPPSCATSRPTPASATARPGAGDADLPDVELPCLGGGPDVARRHRGPGDRQLLGRPTARPASRRCRRSQEFHEQYGDQVAGHRRRLRRPTPEAALDLAKRTGATYPSSPTPAATSRTTDRSR